MTYKTDGRVQGGGSEFVGVVPAPPRVRHVEPLPEAPTPESHQAEAERQTKAAVQSTLAYLDLTRRWLHAMPDSERRLSQVAHAVQIVTDLAGDLR